MLSLYNARIYVEFRFLRFISIHYIELKLYSKNSYQVLLENCG